MKRTSLLLLIALAMFLTLNLHAQLKPVLVELYDIGGSFPENVVYPEEGTIEYTIWMVNRPLDTQSHPGTCSAAMDPDQGRFMLQWNMDNFDEPWIGGEIIRIELVQTTTGYVVNQEFAIVGGSSPQFRLNELALVLTNPPVALFDSNLAEDHVLYGPGVGDLGQAAGIYYSDDWATDRYMYIGFPISEISGGIVVDFSMRRQYQQGGPPFFNLEQAGPRHWYTEYRIDGGAWTETAPDFGNYYSLDASGAVWYNGTLEIPWVRSGENMEVRWVAAVNPEAGNGYMEMRDVYAEGTGIVEDDNFIPPGEGGAEVAPGIVIIHNGAENIPYDLDFDAPPTPPTGTFTSQFSILLTGSGVVEIVIDGPGQYGWYYQNGEWHGPITPVGGVFTFNIDFDALRDGDVIIDLGDDDPQPPHSVPGYVYPTGLVEDVPLSPTFVWLAPETGPEPDGYDMWLYKTADPTPPDPTDIDLPMTLSYDYPGTLDPNTIYSWTVRPYVLVPDGRSYLPAVRTRAASRSGGDAVRDTKLYPETICPVGTFITGDEDLPVELSSFTASETANTFVELQWVSETETNLLGYHIFRSNNNELNEAIVITGAIIDAHNSSTTTEYSYVDEEVIPGETYFYWLQHIDFDLTSGFHGPVSVTLEETEPDVPEVFVTALRQNYPNPFNPDTTIKFSLSDDYDMVELKVYNLLGQVVRTLVDRPLAKGEYTEVWDGRDNSGKTVTSGIYFYRLTTPTYNKVHKMMLVK
jgi:hypothetical protein